MKLKLEIAVKPKKLSSYAKSQKLCKGMKARDKCWQLFAMKPKSGDAA